VSLHYERNIYDILNPTNIIFYQNGKVFTSIKYLTEPVKVNPVKYRIGSNMVTPEEFFYRAMPSRTLHVKVGSDKISQVIIRKILAGISDIIDIQYEDASVQELSIGDIRFSGMVTQKNVYDFVVNNIYKKPIII
jgi:hypothetical protein